MCQNVALINDVVNEFVNDGKMFTAYNVTTEVRKRTKDRIAHDEVKRDVHRMFNDGEMFSYNRSLAMLPGINPQPWVYHPLAADISLYNGQPTGTVTSTPPFSGVPTLIPHVPNSISTNAVASDNVFKLDTTNRLCVPAKLIRNLGLSAGDQAAVMYDSELILTSEGKAATMTSADYITSYVVDSYDNVRLTLTALQKGRLNGTEFEIEGDLEKVTIRPH
jgi:hypothetical protein